jgi:hypothetical protein
MRNVKIWLQVLDSDTCSKDVKREVPEIVYDWLVDLAEELNNGNNDGYYPTMQIEEIEG